MLMDPVFELDPAEEGNSNGEVEEPFVGDCENDGKGPESEEYDHMALEIMFSWTQDMGKRQDKGCNCLPCC